MSTEDSERIPFTTPMNLTCTRVGPPLRPGAYEYRIVLNNHGPALAPPAQGWLPLPGFQPDPSDKYHASGLVGKPDPQGNQSDADADLTGAQMAIYYRQLKSEDG